MGVSGNFTLFTNSSGGGGAGSGDYVKDNFRDTSVPATSNSGFSSTVSTNPLTKFFGNDDSVKYGAKTLWVKDLVLVEDRTKWINSKPTYEIVWNETFPGVAGYVYGNVRLRNNPQGIAVTVNNIDDGVGVSGVIRRAAFILNSNPSTGTADIIVDGTDTTTDATFGSAATGAGVFGINNFLAPPAAVQTNNIHDYRLTANQNQVLSIAGVVVYFENSGNNIECLPGSTYVDKTKATTSVGATLSLPTYTGRLGGVGLVSKSSTGVYSTTNLEIPTIETVGVGLSGTISIDVTTGQGSSFKVGAGVVGIAGTSYYIGSVKSISTDTLTVGPTIRFGLSGPLYVAFNAGPTYAISSTFYKYDYSFDAGQANVQADYLYNFGYNSTGDFYYSDQYKRYRAWGDAMQWTFQDGFNGVAFNSASLGFIQFDGKFSAVDIEFVAAPGSTGILHGTFSVCGVPGVYGINEPFVGSSKKTVFTDAGPGYNSFRFSSGASFGNVVINKVNFYTPLYNVGTSFGRLAYLPTNQNKAYHGAVNASLITLGTEQRLFADEMYLTGAWTRGITHTAAGGVHYIGASVNCQMTMNYFGTDYAVVGVQGASVVITFDGGAASSSMNILNSVATLGFHTVVVSSGGATVALSAFDYVRPKGEIVSLQNYQPEVEVDSTVKVWSQTDTPQNPKHGDIWARFPAINDVWIYLFNRWNQVAITATSDDPNVGIFVRTHGFTTSNEGTGTGNTEMFNFVSWSSGTASGTARSRGGSAESGYLSQAYWVDGQTTAGSVMGLDNEAFNKIAWIAKTNRTTARGAFGFGVFGGFLHCNKGSVDSNLATGSTVDEAWNNAAWISKTAWANQRYWISSFVIGQLMSVVGGYNAADAGQTDHETRTTADSVGTATVIPAASLSIACANVTAALAIVINRQTAHDSDSTSCYTWNGSAWSASLTSSYTTQPRSGPAAGSAIARGFAIWNGGGSNTSSTSTARYNGVAFNSDLASIGVIGAAGGSVI